jgi:hypothetical protein
MSRQQWGHGYWTGYAQGQKAGELTPVSPQRVFSLSSQGYCQCEVCREIQRSLDQHEDQWQLAVDWGFLINPGVHLSTANEWYVYCLRHQQPCVLVGYDAHAFRGQWLGGWFVEADFRPSRRCLTQEGWDIIQRWLRHYNKQTETHSSWGVSWLTAALSEVPLADARTFARVVLLAWHRHHQPVQELPGYLDNGRHAREIDAAAEALHQAETLRVWHTIMPEAVAGR